ncbi:MAG: C10 family peptidase [Bacteroidota bacterium]|nr:C10 family peptidase [Bacteroidota bacterium]
MCGAFAGSGYGVLGNCSTWTYPGDINNALANMGFSNGGTWDSLSDNYQIVKGELKYFHPVIMTGTTGIFNLTNAHIWVADGYDSLAYEYESIYYDEFGNPHCTCVQYSREMISMCWGQYNGSGNGFYLAHYSFTDCSGDSYDTYLRALTGIRP